MRSFSYYAGFAVGMLFVLMLVFLLSKLIRKAAKTSTAKPEFDERQLASRGEAYRLGFLSMMICCILYAMLEGLELHLFTVPTGIFLCIFISAGVFAVTAIRKDAYFGFNTGSRYYTILYMVIGGLNLLCGIVQNITSGFMKDGLVGSCVINYGIAALFIVILLTQLLHNRRMENNK